MDTAVVTGASGVVGEAVARRFGAEGVHVVCSARDADEADAVADGIESEGGSATPMRVDVRDEFDLERLMETAARERSAGIDCVIPAAETLHGTPGQTPLADEAYSAFDDTLRTNARGVFATVREAVPHLADDARLLVPSPRVAREASSGYGAYAVSKAAAEAAVRQFAAELPYVVGAVETGRIQEAEADEGEAPSEADIAATFWWAATGADADSVDGAVVETDAREAADE